MTPICHLPYQNSAQMVFLKIKLAPKLILGMALVQEKKIIKSYNKDEGLKICVHIQIMHSERYVQFKFVFHGFLTEENRDIT